MSTIDESDDDALIEECIEELDELVMALDRYPPAAVAVALGTYLEGLLGAFLDECQCTADEVRQLLREMESSVLESPGPAWAWDDGPRTAPSGGDSSDKVIVGRAVSEIALRRYSGPRTRTVAEFGPVRLRSSAAIHGRISDHLPYQLPYGARRSW